jgi:hypothetical protein
MSSGLANSHAILAVRCNSFSQSARIAACRRFWKNPNIGTVYQSESAVLCRRGAMELFGRIFSFLRGLRSQQPSPAVSQVEPPPWDDSLFGYLSAVGESLYQPALRRVARSGRVCWATLISEPTNPFDANAVVVQIQNEVVGYLTRSDARRYQPRLRALEQPLQVPAKLIGGTRDRPSFGVLLDCRAIERLPKPRRVREKGVSIDPTDQPF